MASPTGPSPADSTPPDSFIITDTTASQWNVNTSPVWTAILADTTLGLHNPSGNTPSGTITISSDYFWTLSFSNQANVKMFGNNSPVLANPDWTTTPPVQGAVLGMQTPTGGLLTQKISLDDVATKFGISLTTGPALLTSFSTAVDSASLELDLNTSATTRNALWAVPGELYQVVVSLTFDIKTTGSLSQLQSFINQQFGLNLSLTSINAQVIFTSFTSYTETSTSPVSVTASTTPNYNMIVQFQISGFDVSLLFTATDAKLAFSDTGTSAGSASVYSQLQGAGLTSSSASGSTTSLSANALPDNSKSSPFDTFLSEVKLWYLIIGFDNISSSSSSGSNGDIYWEVGLLGNFKVGSNPQQLLAAVAYDSRVTTFSGQLVLGGNLPSSSQYDYQTWLAIPSSAVGSAANMDYSSIYGGSLSGTKPPSQIPGSNANASIVYQQTPSGNGYSFSVSFSIEDNPPGTGTSNSAAAPNGFGTWPSLSVNLLLSNDGTTGATPSALVQVLANIALPPSTQVSTVTQSPAINLDLEFDSADNYWFLEASADYVQIGNLTSYFDSSITSHVQKTVGSLYIKNLDIVYTFNGTGDSSSFLFQGSLVLGELELDLYYQYQSTGVSSVGGKTASSLVWPNGAPANTTPSSSLDAQTPWVFEAFLGAASPNSTLQSVVSHISPGTNLPSFVGGIPVNPSSGGNAPGKLKLMPLESTSGVEDGLLLIVQIVLADLDFTFVYLSTSAETQVIFRVSVDQIPLISSIPLIKQLPQPFDSLLYLYLDGETGISQDDLDNVNTQLGSLKIPPIAYQGTNTSGSSSAPVALQAGHHFMVIQNSNVVLDHVFNDADAKSQDPAMSSSTSAAGTSTALVISPLAAPATTDDSNDPAPTKGNLDVQLPFLSISGLTFQFKQGSLYIDIDATLLLGPISFTAIGFEIVLHLSKVVLNDLSQMLTNGFITFGIHGLDISIDQSPLEIAGVFIHTLGTDQQGDSIDEYMGGVAIGFEEWQFVAVGAYEIVTSATSKYKSVFIYAKLNGPLFSLGFATVSGVRLGFGYNSVVRSPTMNQLPQFPFLTGDSEDGAGNDPLKILMSMTGGAQPWVSPQEDAYWGAVGLTLTAFEVLSVTAVLMMGFQQAGVVISVFADGIAQMPPDVDADETLFYVEIYMLAELNTVQGFFTVQASLAPSSHVLVPSCRLTGGFALVNWFNPNAHSGDFVFTVGGYHPAYTPPSWYPVPARLGISFTLGSMINVTGTVYFAICPKCVMGGGGLDMTLSIGPVSAWLSISLDVFVQFKPFYYTAELKVSVGCAMSINVWFVHVRISVSVGADLYVEGPNPFGGYANVDFYLFSFTIHFGDQSTGPPPLALLDFYSMVKTPGPAPAANSSATPADPMQSQLKFVLTSGIYQAPTAPGGPATSTTASQFPDSGATTVWNTKAGTFGCSIDCDFALSSATLVNDQSTPPATPPTTLLPSDGSASAPAFYPKPMHATASDTIDSALTITVWVLNPDGTKASVQGGFGGLMVLKQVPVAIWGAYDPANDPTTTATPSDLTNPSTPTTVQLCMAVSLTPPSPAIEQSNIPDFDATATFIWILESVPLPPLVSKQSTLLASGVVDLGQTPQQQWAQVQSDWTTFATAGLPILGGTVTAGVQSPGLLQMAAQTLGWNQSSPSAVLEAVTATTSSTGTATTPATPPNPTWMLNGEMPDFLIQNLDTQYPVLPRESASGVAV